MVRQARKRNKKSIKEKRVRLGRESVCCLPYENDRFDKVFAINSFHHWPQPQDNNLKEILRVLKPGGRIFIAEQPHWVQDETEVLQIAEGYKVHLNKSGFEKVEIKSKSMEPGLCFILTGEKESVSSHFHGY